MHIVEIIREEIRNQNTQQYKPSGLDEEVRGEKLYGYHCTLCKNLKNIEQQGLKVGSRDMQGTGLYAFYNLNDNTSGGAAVGYGFRHIDENGFCVVKFEVNNPRAMTILIKDIAEQVFGNDADIVKQLENQFGSWDNYMQQIYKYMKPEFRTKEYGEELKQWARQEFNRENGQGSQNLMFGKTYLSDVVRTGVIFAGEYGISYLIKAPSALNVLGYHEVTRDENYKTKVSEFKGFTGKQEEFQKALEKYEILSDLNISDVDDVSIFIAKFDDELNNVRNNRDYDFYQKRLNALRELQQQFQT